MDFKQTFLDNIRIGVDGTKSAYSFFPTAVPKAPSGHLLTNSAFFQKIFFCPFYQSAQKHVGLMNQGNCKVANHFRRTFIEQLAIIGRIVVGSADFSKFVEAWIPESPLLKIIYSQVVLVVQQKLLKRSFGNIEQLDFRFTRSGGSCAPLGNILFSAARCLNHLVRSSIAPRNIFARKENRDVEYAF